MEPTHRHRVRYHETDAQGYLFNSRYLELVDVAMTEFFRALGWPYPDLVAGGTDPSVVTATVHFRSPARFEDVLDLTVSCLQVGTSSFTLGTEITLDARAVATAELVYVNVEPDAGVSRPLPAEIAASLRRSQVSQG